LCISRASLAQAVAGGGCAGLPLVVDDASLFVQYCAFILYGAKVRDILVVGYGSVVGDAKWHTAVVAIRVGPEVCEQIFVNEIAGDVK
jgi:hypothetical protein